ncbi:MAG: hypothetical protein A2268_01865 [Candidatus Raymondbacteria bacterium RifOxyA12_full_50_37]|uniref:ADP-ribosylglycohydrolase n=1 Tax=Candidatus Raymondbacteria bacterium RIFOXYD12_FULL_49_13 TaxID=1817890 RepID=A0A1F7F5R6_UNCRA|nr:MAG: hypothetical protein A2268_01865 [Candidatus Raymondbacteria bacterium RifOxyA12_full_50_37]OGJ92089.1 MAG: hypothetical protein A2248_10695 [Candidatus Raymondbacteria bacterium RIFOXYA2_FULL_49_16]OGJ98446.1 MAG: hypothetical protein A2453_06935 [Candidatus Raymondbacteria bacterium RIFOXYC2_FULL_50_21]OGK02000.1 MAG: hypothetical protein A2519_17460 [Candidatus Raymondbacteria bacterium RIFOXYD12_FULL_49_13]OGK02319.1 MAG: hypothetical protein A2487_02275 [Candidatus Raymondbacteria 
MARYQGIPDLDALTYDLHRWAELRYEEGGKIAPVLAEVEKAMNRGMARLKTLPVDKAMRQKEPDDLASIRKLRPKGPRVLWKSFDATLYNEKLPGALLARCAGCTMGAIVEFYDVDRMKSWAMATGDPFPPTGYWTKADLPDELRYHKTKRQMYTKGSMDGVPVDDDLAYTLLGMLIAEDHGVNFTVEDVGKAWKKYLPYACTAEKVALENLKKGVPALKAAEINNPYVQWIGADIRADPFGYMAPGLPEKAAEMAYHEAYISHRRNGIYGEMFFAAAIAAAFAVNDPIEAIRIGLTEIPAECLLAKHVKWALVKAPSIKNYMQARAATDKYFGGMSGVHTNLNAALTIFGLSIGQKDVVKTLGETIAMGQDNDCTAATAGSIIGAIAGKSKIPAHLTRPFNNKMHSYLIKRPLFKLDNIFQRFGRLAQKVHESI